VALAHLSGGAFRADFVTFVYDETPVLSASWGSIKSLFR